jgi:hypothetical protein
MLIVLWYPMGGAKGNGFCMRDGFGDQDCLGAFAFFLFVCVVAELHEGIVHTIRSVVRLRADSRERGRGRGGERGREREREAKVEWTCLITLILTDGFASFFKSELVLMCCRRKGTWAHFQVESSMDVDLS